MPEIDGTPISGLRWDAITNKRIIQVLSATMTEDERLRVEAAIAAGAQVKTYGQLLDSYPMANGDSLLVTDPALSQIIYMGSVPAVLPAINYARKQFSLNCFIDPNDTGSAILVIAYSASATVLKWMLYETIIIRPGNTVNKLFIPTCPVYQIGVRAIADCTDSLYLSVLVFPQT